MCNVVQWHRGRCVGARRSMQRWKRSTANGCQTVAIDDGCRHIDRTMQRCNDRSIIITIGRSRTRHIVIARSIDRCHRTHRLRLDLRHRTQRLRLDLRCRRRIFIAAMASLLSCGICTEAYTAELGTGDRRHEDHRPVVLRCGHTMCHDCMDLVLVPTVPVLVPTTPYVPRDDGAMG